MTSLRPLLHRPHPALLTTMCANLRSDACAIVVDLLPMPLLAALDRDCKQAAASGGLTRATTGRQEDRGFDPARRGDSIRWLQQGSGGPAHAEFLARMDGLRLALNRELMLGLDELEAHFAEYPAGAGYVRHRDSFRDDDARLLSVVVYLNPAWVDGDGGELRMHLATGARDVEPCAGTTVLFVSAEVEHEVRPTTRSRRSIAGWFRRSGRSPRS
jgi:SM-20-related protein